MKNPERRLNVISSPPPTSVTVTVPARLHLGFLDLNGELGRKFGSIGLAISGFRTQVTITRAAQTRVEGPDADRARRHLDAMRDRLSLETGHHAKVNEAIPAHAGLGSGTQLALGVAWGVRALHKLQQNPDDDAVLLGRGARSGIGVGMFYGGGLVVDGGRGEQTRMPPIVGHAFFPEHWRIVVMLDPKRQGVHGADEINAFSRLAPMAAADAAHLCRLVLMKALPAVAEADLVSFGSAITELQTRLGDYFAPAQGGGRFSSPDVAAVLRHLETQGACGIGQSSWGPTGFAFAESEAQANQFAAHARQHPDGRGLDIRICAGLNRGAEITAQE
jgi:beta-ribofuranosylaminobenzene 5'-phosphate synthase